MNKKPFTRKSIVPSGIRTAVMFLVFLACGNISQGAMAPSTGKKWQKKASEKISIIVLESHSRIIEREKAFADDIEVTAKVKVVSVDRTKSNLKKGQIIDILYTSMSSLDPPAGSWPRVVVTGKYCVAYLNLKEGKKTYSPAAASYSFVYWNAEQFRAHRKR